MRYIWNEIKAEINLNKHGIRFEEAQVIWTDSNSIKYFDGDNFKYEDRYIRIGLNPERGILIVVFCEKEDQDEIRIISARKATGSEKKEYEEELQSQRS